MKLSQILNSQEALNRILQIKLPVKISYKIGKMFSRIQPEIRTFEEKRVGLIKKLGTEDKVKQIWEVLPDNMAEFQQELNKLGDIEVNLGFGVDKELEKILIADLGDAKLEPRDLIQLEWLFN